MSVTQLQSCFEGNKTLNMGLVIHRKFCLKLHSNHMDLDLAYMTRCRNDRRVAPYHYTV